MAYLGFITDFHEKSPSSASHRLKGLKRKSVKLWAENGQSWSYLIVPGEDLVTHLPALHIPEEIIQNIPLVEALTEYSFADTNTLAAALNTAETHIRERRVIAYYHNLMNAGFVLRRRISKAASPRRINVRYN